MADIFRRFASAHPGVRIENTFGNQDSLIALLVAGELDLVIGRPEHPSPRSALKEKPLAVEEQGIALCKDDPLAADEKISVTRLDGRRLLLMRGNLHFGQLLLEHAAARGVSLYPSHDAADFSSLYWMVRAGLGIAPISLALDPPPGLVARRLKPALPKLKLHAIFSAASPSPGSERIAETT